MGVALIIFVISMNITSTILNRGNTDMTTTMAKASLPIIYLNVNDEYINPLHGYLGEMEGNYLRGPITPLMANRELSFRADLYDAVIAKVGFEVRSMDMSRLIEDTEISDFQFEKDAIFATLQIKDLIEEEQEYMVIIKLTTSSGDIIKYYARVINRAELYLGEKMDFVKNFSEMTFNKENIDELKIYMESNAEGDNSSFGHVDIHSSFNQLTWGNLHPKVITDKDMELLEIDPDNACIMLSYQVNTLGHTHNVSEFYRLRKGPDRMFLIDYERTMNQVLNPDENIIINNKVLHGIVNEKIQSIEDETASIYAFVQQNSLYSFNTSNGTLAKVFSFYDSENNDARTRYNQHNIKPLNIDESGNIQFIVYGYMNRGIHEGSVGVTFYTYDSSFNTIEENFFLPYKKSYQVLKEDIDSLAYINARGKFYILMDGSVYNINLETKETTVLKDSISETKFVSCEDQSLIAIQSGEDLSNYNELLLYNLDYMTPTTINADSDSIIIPLGFMGHDFIYGLSRNADLTNDGTGRALIPMYSIHIQDEKGNMLKNYSAKGAYVTKIDIEDNMISLTRVAHDEETGIFTETAPDQILSTASETVSKNELTSIVAEESETTYQTVLYKEYSGNIKVTSPKEILFEDNRDISLSHPDALSRYYLYCKNDITKIFDNPSECIQMADEIGGVVVDKYCSYIWESSNRLPSNMLELELPEGTSATSFDEEGNETEITASSYALCLDVMLRSMGVYKDTSMLLKNDSIMGIMEKNSDNTILDLSGCNLKSVLYYISKGYPVMGICPGGNAYVITGYDSKTIYLYTPQTGKTEKMGLDEAINMFSQSGNQFISYVK